MHISAFDGGAPIPLACAYTVLVPMPGSIMAASARGSAKTVVVCPLIFMMDLLVSMRRLSLMKNKAFSRSSSLHQFPSFTSFLLLCRIIRSIPRADAR